MSDLDLDAIEARLADLARVTHANDKRIFVDPSGNIGRITAADSAGGTKDIVLCWFRKDWARKEDGVFLAHAYADIPALVAEVKRLRSLNFPTPPTDQPVQEPRSTA